MLHSPSSSPEYGTERGAVNTSFSLSLRGLWLLPSLEHSGDYFARDLLLPSPLWLLLSLHWPFAQLSRAEYVVGDDWRRSQCYCWYLRYSTRQDVSSMRLRMVAPCPWGFTDKARVSLPGPFPEEIYITWSELGQEQ